LNFNFVGSFQHPFQYVLEKLIIEHGGNVAFGLQRSANIIIGKISGRHLTKLNEAIELNSIILTQQQLFEIIQNSVTVVRPIVVQAKRPINNNNIPPQGIAKNAPHKSMTKTDETFYAAHPNFLTLLANNSDLVVKRTQGPSTIKSNQMDQKEE
jgi:hypothetical protein